ncbi:S-layer homology domain-containing protein [Bacillus sp. CGMCC 1.16541]|uniref:S-layer homology domain-containing protein n=1 Tax=Bacillus sp. CGMCC 1.16541 TaxID=2185143 RepID=UPI000D727E81|nr:S-layer homology domain-containing protein [Bacillus sp. CGMCC 1.16541]
MKKWPTILLTASLVTGHLTLSPTTHAQVIYSDVTQTHWASDEIEFLYHSGVLDGLSTDTFQPGKPITRMEAVQMIMNAYEGDYSIEVTGPLFPDVTENDDGYLDVAAAVQLGIISGKTNENGQPFFDPNGTLTRAQMAKILANAFKLAGVSTKTFKDVTSSHWAYSYIQALAKHHITTGYEDGRFGGNDKLTRVQFSVMLARVLNEKFRDIPVVKPKPPAPVMPTPVNGVYPDGWKAPILRSAWKNSGSYTTQNIIEEELGFVSLSGNSVGTSTWKTPDNPRAIDVYRNPYDPSTVEVEVRINDWWNEKSPYAYRVRVIGKQLFHYFFEKDADKVYQSFNTLTVPETFTANGRKVEAYLSHGVAHLKIYKQPMIPPTGNLYPDGWRAPQLQSSWSPDPAVNYGILERELGFSNNGSAYDIYGYPKIIHVMMESKDHPIEVNFKFLGWEDSSLKQSYRVPIITKELFKLYFEKDVDRVWNYFNKNDIPETFMANGRTVKASYIPVDGSIYLQVGRKKK